MRLTNSYKANYSKESGAIRSCIIFLAFRQKEFPFHYYPLKAVILFLFRLQENRKVNLVVYQAITTLLHPKIKMTRKIKSRQM